MDPMPNPSNAKPAHKKVDCQTIACQIDTASLSVSMLDSLKSTANNLLVNHFLHSRPTHTILKATTSSSLIPSIQLHASAQIMFTPNFPKVIAGWWKTLHPLITKHNQTVGKQIENLSLLSVCSKQLFRQKNARSPTNFN